MNTSTLYKSRLQSIYLVTALDNLNNIDFIVQSYNQIRTKVSEDTTIVLDCKSIILDDYTSSLLHDLRGDVIIISNTSSAD